MKNWNMIKIDLAHYCTHTNICTMSREECTLTEESWASIAIVLSDHMYKPQMILMEMTWVTYKPWMRQCPMQYWCPMQDWLCHPCRMQMFYYEIYMASEPGHFVHIKWHQWVPVAPKFSITNKECTRFFHKLANIVLRGIQMATSVHSSELLKSITDILCATSKQRRDKPVNIYGKTKCI